MFSLVGEVNGRANTRRELVRWELNLKEKRVSACRCAPAPAFRRCRHQGLTKFSPRSGVTVGVTYDTPPFQAS